MAVVPTPCLELATAALRRARLGLLEEAFGRIAEAVPELSPAAQPEMAAYVRGAGEQIMDFAFDLLERGAMFDALPPAALDEARLAASLGIGLDRVTRGYRVGHAVLLERLVVAVEETGADGPARVEALTTGSRRLFEGIDRAVALVTDAYVVERERLVRSAEQRRLALVREVVSGGDVDSGDLGWDLSATHLALVAWGPEADAVAGRIAERVGGLRALSVALSADAAWAWLAGDREALRRAGLGAGAAAAECGVAFGEPLAGVGGFRRSLAQARAAQGVALRRPGDRHVVAYREVALEALASADREAERAFVAEELGELATADERTAVLRETLLAYFAAGHNAASAGAALGVHERTVAYRLRTIEDRLGFPPARRRAELETALRLYALR